jgi:hypothetical protein
MLTVYKSSDRVCSVVANFCATPNYSSSMFLTPLSVTINLPVTEALPYLPIPDGKSLRLAIRPFSSPSASIVRQKPIQRSVVTIIFWNNNRRSLGSWFPAMRADAISRHHQTERSSGVASEHL